MRRTLDEVTELARTKNPVASSGLLKERASAQLQLGRAEAILRSGCLLLLDTALYQRLRALDHDEVRSEDLLSSVNRLSWAAPSIGTSSTMHGTLRARTGLIPCPPRLARFSGAAADSSIVVALTASISCFTLATAPAPSSLSPMPPSVGSPSIHRRGRGTPGQHSDTTVATTVRTRASHRLLL
jgi:hypothetical protein